MATIYWTGNQTTGSILASSGTLWAPNADGSGTLVPPAAVDDCIIGHEDTIKANKGNAKIDWDTTAVRSITVLPKYKYETTYTAVTIAFANTANTLTSSTDNWVDLGFRVGMYVTITGSASNSGSFPVTAISGNIMTISAVTADETAGPSVTVAHESSINLRANVTLGHSSSQTSLALNGTLKNTTGSNKTITFTLLAGANSRYITNGDNAQVLNQDDITYDFGTGTGQIGFDDGPYPKVTCSQARQFSVDYLAAPTSTVHGAVTMYSLAITNTGASTISAFADVKNDSTKIFKLLTTSTFDYNPTTFQSGSSTWHFKMDGNFTFPVSGSSSYGANDGTFVGLWHNLVLDTPDTNGRKATIPQGRTLSVNSLTIESGAVLEGYATGGNSETSIVTSVRRPKVKGAWNFSQVADGIYTSIVTDTYPVTPSNGPGGRVQLSDNAGKFTSDPALSFAEDTLHVDRGIKITEFTDHGTAPGSGYGVLWVKTTTPNTLIFTDENGTDTTLGSGGGGGGGMTSWTLSGDSGSNQTISDGNTVDIAGGTGISTAASATDTVTVTNTGVTSNVAGAGIGVSGATGAVTVSNTGVTSNVAGANIAVSGATGAVTVSAPFPEQPAGAIPAFSIVPDEVGKVPFGWIEVVTVSGQTVFVPAWVAI